MFWIIRDNSNYFITFSILIFIFLLNIIYEYLKYVDFKDEEIYETKASIVNIYNKKDYHILKLNDNDMDFFVSIYDLKNINKFDLLNITIATKNIDFIDYMKGFYTKIIYYDLLDKSKTLEDKLSHKITNQHNENNTIISELFNALFLAQPISTKLREICTNYGISHLIALSGFHIGVISLLVYWGLYYPYSFFHQRYFPYRNIKFDLMLIVIVILFIYLVLTNFIPSLSRAFVMLVLGIFLLRSNIKIFSFLNLCIVFLIIIAIFPKYMFSLSLWFSIFGVFYIFLYIQYFKDYKNIYVQLIIFNIWIYLAMNPIVHYFFDTTTYEQLISPLLTILFTIFYPFELFLHFIGYGALLDEYLLIFLERKFDVFSFYTSFWFLLVYLIISLSSIFNKKAFLLLNILLLGFSLIMYI